MSFPLKFSVSAPGKVILFGDHSVVYGKPALAAAINKRTSLIFETDDSNFIKLNCPSLKLKASIPVELIKEVLHECPVSDSPDGHSYGDFDGTTHHNLLSMSIDTYERLDGCKSFDANQRLSILCLFYTLFRLHTDVKAAIGAFTINVSTDLTIGAGTGSSASFCVCVAAALFRYFRALRANENAGEINRPFSAEVSSKKKIRKFEK